MVSLEAVVVAFVILCSVEVMVVAVGPVEVMVGLLGL